MIPRVEFYEGFWTADQVAADATHYWIFGDNCQGWGHGGQACIRGLPNAFGIPTKKSPAMDDSAFFTDEEFLDNLIRIVAAFQRIPTDRPWYISSAGLGSGLAQLPARAPRTHAALVYIVQTLARG